LLPFTFRQTSLDSFGFGLRFVNLYSKSFDLNFLKFKIHSSWRFSSSTIESIDFVILASPGKKIIRNSSLHRSVFKENHKGDKTLLVLEPYISMTLKIHHNPLFASLFAHHDSCSAMIGQQALLDLYS